MSDLTKTFIVAFVTAAATAVVTHVVMTRLDPRFQPIQRGAPQVAAQPGATTPAQPGAQPGAQPTATSTGAPVATPAPSGGGQPAAVATGTTPRSVEIPKLVGQPVAAAKKLIASRHLQFVAGASRHDAEVPKDHVITQTPLAGSSAKPGSEVRVLVSKGPAPIEVPDVTGVNADEAGEMLAKANLKKGAVTERKSEAPKGEVIETEPLAGQTVPAGTEVALVVSEGAEEFPVPKVLRHRVGAARRKLQDAGFEAAKVKWTYNMDYEPGIIIRQSPKPGTLAPLGTVVQIWGSEPEED